eukprot:TRINITY_DN75759_c0_g1_i1.p1 TRINITY_DN75759_c0_g1~~TRINITY_DN75759_c0_g1_i1.p1  ORF type:complete len:324 (-),score=98.46 TRINITY_DN75759_c0_g1_i1:46-1017(-)
MPLASHFHALLLALVFLLSSFHAGVASPSCGGEAQGCRAAEDERALDMLADQEDEEAAELEVQLLQTQLTTQRTAVVEQANRSDNATGETVAKDQQGDDHVISLDHAGRVCMLCNKPLPDRIGSRQYTEFRTDCGSKSSPTGPSAEDMARPTVELWQRGSQAAAASNGFCELNFAKSCADAVANKDYLYWPKSLDLNHASLSSNVPWNKRYCQLNGFLEQSVAMLQHNFTAMQQKAQEQCNTKYAKHGIEKLTFLDMLELSKHEDAEKLSLEEAERMAAWNCAMGDLGCDMAMCAYSFCVQPSGKTGLYSECQGWDPVAGMPF